MSSEFCLRWNNHRPNLVSVFKELLQHEVLVDVTLAAEGQFIHAHKLVLSACSLYFKELFAGNPCQHPIVILKDFRLADLKTVVDFIYQGEVNVKQERLPHVLKAAESLRIKGLAENPHSFEEFQPTTAASQHNAPGTPRLGSQASSLQQSSSLSDSREQSLSLEGEEGDNNGPAAVHSPPIKRRRLGHYDDHDTQHDGSTDSVRVKEEPSGPAGAATAGDDRQGTAGDVHQGYRGRDPSLLLVQGGGISPSEGSSGGGGQGVGECSSPVPPDPATGGSSPTPPPSLPATPSLSITNATTNNGDSNSSSGGGGGAAAALTPPDSAALLPHPNAGRNRRAVLQRQPGIIRDGSHTAAASTFSSPDKRLVKEDLRRAEETHQDPLQTTQYSEYILPPSLSVTTVPSGSSFGTDADSVFGSTETVVTSTVPYSDASQDIPTYGFSGTSLLPVPAVFVAAPRESGGGGSLSGTGPGHLPKQGSQPEMSDSRSLEHQYTHHPTISRSLGSIGSSGSLGAPSTSTYMQGSGTSSGGQQLQVVQMFVKQPQQSSRGSSSGPAPSSITCVAAGQSPVNLRPIQPKPSHEEGQRISMKEEQGMYHRKDQGPPQIRLTPSEDVTPSGPQPPRVSRAISEELLASRGSAELLGPGPAPLTQSVSEDTGLDGGGFSRLMPPSAASQQQQHQQQSSSGSSGLFSTSHLRYSSLSTVPPTSGHRLAQRDGPALGCNFCWNSTDDLGRIQRRKTKYHCPECRTNLCIVPCYQKYHMQMERSDDTDKQISKILTKTSSV